MVPKILRWLITIIRNIKCVAHAGGVNYIGCIYNKYWLSNSSGPDTMKEVKKSLLVPISRGRDWGSFSSRSLPKTPDPGSGWAGFLSNRDDSRQERNNFSPLGQRWNISHQTSWNCLCMWGRLIFTKVPCLFHSPACTWAETKLEVLLTCLWFGSQLGITFPAPQAKTQGSFLQNTTGVLVPPPRRAACNTCVPVYSTWDHNREPATEHPARKAYAHSFPH